MSSENEVISIKKDDYYKIYLEQRQKLHAHLIQQLLAKSQTKKQLVLAKSADIIDNFSKYCEEFIKNMPNELRAIKVKDYLANGTSNFQQAIKGSNGEALTSLYKIFQNELDKAKIDQKDTPDHSLTDCYSGKKIKLKKDKPKHLEEDETGLIRDITNNQNKYEKESIPQSVGKPKGRTENTISKSSKKRKWDQLGSNTKENRNTPTFHQSKQNFEPKPDLARSLFSDKKTPMLVNYINRMASPKRPWMP